MCMNSEDQEFRKDIAGGQLDSVPQHLGAHLQGLQGWGCSMAGQEAMKAHPSMFGS